MKTFCSTFLKGMNVELGLGEIQLEAKGRLALGIRCLPWLLDELLLDRLSLFIYLAELVQGLLVLEIVI